MGDGARYTIRGEAMTKKSPKDVPFGIPEETQERAKEMVQGALQEFEKHLKSISDDVAEFNRRRRELRGRMQHGARRTSGRIV